MAGGIRIGAIQHILPVMETNLWRNLLKWRGTAEPPPAQHIDFKG
jgi:hypothetical protein